ncbi:MAG: hypothetical protein PHG67_04300 [Bacteroidales bacterium]|nr:hypothetical protein [Bacteroidales bacterium]
MPNHTNTSVTNRFDLAQPYLPGREVEIPTYIIPATIAATLSACPDSIVGRLRYQAKSLKHFKSSPGWSPQELVLLTARLKLGTKKIQAVVNIATQRGSRIVHFIITLVIIFYNNSSTFANKINNYYLHHCFSLINPTRKPFKQ